MPTVHVVSIEQVDDSKVDGDGLDVSKRVG
jgi:hypothetical protein